METATLPGLLRQYFGYDSFRPLQGDIIARVMSGGSSLVLMPTGGGKSLTYQLPALALPGLTIVISPLIALMKDQVDKLRASGIPCAYLNSTLSSEEHARVRSQVASRSLKLLYLAPEQLATARTKELFASTHLSLIAIDEAHCISEWGHDFRPDYRLLQGFLASFPDVPVLALTATATRAVKDDILTALGIPHAQVFESGFDRPNLTYRVLPKKNAADALISLLQARSGDTAIAYCFSRADTEKLAERLTASGISALPYHAGLTSEKRDKHQEAFLKDKITVMCATIAFGMGIDKPDIRLVAHMDLPKSLEGYYQETGRAGRDGLPSECILFYSYADRRKHELFMRDLTSAERERGHHKLDAMVRYCELPSCRRKYLLEYFGEQVPDQNCGGCDICLGGEKQDITLLAQKMLSAVIRTGSRYGVGYIIALLRGKSDARMEANSHHHLPTFGVASDNSVAVLSHVSRVLVQQGLLTVSPDQYRTLSVTPLGITCLRERTLVLAAGMPEQRPEKQQRIRSGKPTIPESPLATALRQLRKELALRDDVPPYVIFGDRTLLSLLEKLPRTPEELLQITGIGAHKCETYGSALLQTIRMHT